MTRTTRNSIKILLMLDNATKCCNKVLVTRSRMKFHGGLTILNQIPIKIDTCIACIHKPIFQVEDS